MAGITLFRGRQHFCRPHLLASRSTSMANGSQSRYFVHVDDAVQAVLAALARTSTTGQVCNIGTGVETSIARIAKMLSRIMRPSVVPVFLAARVGAISRSVTDVTLAKRLLDYQAKVGRLSGWKLSPCHDCPASVRRLGF